jgi:hypothetical protein
VCLCRVQLPLDSRVEHIETHSAHIFLLNRDYAFKVFSRLAAPSRLRLCLTALSRAPLSRSWKRPCATRL